jgi:hypothetical protein
VQHDGNFGRRLAAARLALFLRDRWHAAAVAEIATPVPIVESEFTVRPRAIRSAGLCMAG